MTRPSPITEDRIRERAYLLWLEEGQPEGKEVEHWEKARALLAQESDPEDGMEGAVEGYYRGAPVEEATLLEFPSVKEEGQKTPKKRRPSVAKKRPM